MKRIDYWLGIAVISTAIVFYAMFPRHQTVLAHGDAFSVDRWTGKPVGRTVLGNCASEVGAFGP